MAEDRPNFLDNGLRIRRERRSEVPKRKRREIADRVAEMAQKDDDERAVERDLRLQRYAKFRMWTGGGEGWPWEGSSDFGNPDMMTDVLSLEDTLHNAVMSNRPISNARAMQGADPEKETLIDDLLDTQVFVEQNGEKAVEESADVFVMDGVCTAHIPWVREERQTVLYRTFPPIKEEHPRQLFEQIIAQEFSQEEAVMLDDEGWDWEITDTTDGQVYKAKFYTASDDEVELVAKRWVTVYDGPKIIIKDFEDVLTPARVANIQIPGPSNPGGSPHVILRDYPEIDELQRLVDSGFYDLVKKSDLKKILSSHENVTEDDEKEQKDIIQGKDDSLPPVDDTHRNLTRYICFDLYAMEEGGINEDMMFWVLEEPRLLLKAMPLTEMYPADPPRRPLAEANLIPVKGRREGISLLEMIESLHDMKKAGFDQMVDTGSLTTMPFGFYRATSNMKPEVLRLQPGDLFPLGDPKNDINFPDIGAGNAQSFWMNILAIADQMQEKLTVRGDLQLGRVPIGRSSALRTSQNLQSLMQAGEARPERILRRFMTLWIEILKQMHELNQHFLPKEKQFRIAGIVDPRDDPYRTVEVATDLKGRFDFDFSVNVLNASKIAMQEALEKIMSVYIGPLPLQLGITTPETIYRLMRDWGKAHGQSTERYLNPPSPDALMPPLLAEEALTKIMQGELPQGTPLEGAQAHMDKLMAFVNNPEMFALLDSPGKVDLFRTYLGSVSQRLQLEAAAQAAGQSGGAPVGGSPGAGAGPPPNLGNPPVNENELLDETLPGAGGGAAGPNGGIQ